MTSSTLLWLGLASVAYASDWCDKANNCVRASGCSKYVFYNKRQSCVDNCMSDYGCDPRNPEGTKKPEMPDKTGCDVCRKALNCIQASACSRWVANYRKAECTKHCMDSEGCDLTKPAKSAKDGCDNCHKALNCIQANGCDAYVFNSAKIECKEKCYKMFNCEGNWM